MIKVRLHPLFLRDGDELTVQVSGLPVSDLKPGTVQMARVDTIESTWTASLGCQMQADGTTTVMWSKVGIGREAAVFATAVAIAGTTYQVDDTSVAVVNPARPVTNPAEAAAYLAELQRQQEARYDTALGDPSVEGALEHRVVCAIERLLVTTPLRLPAVTVLPCGIRPQGDEQRHMVDHIVNELGWPTRIDADWWAKRVSHSRPWTTIVCAPVWATDLDMAAKLAWQVRDDLVAILGINRGARGRPVATVIEQRQPDDSIENRFYLEDAGYRGNLMGGFISGENQSQLLAQHHAMRSDPLLRMCVDLYAEALADHSPDARFFRIWSLLETLSHDRVARGKPVLLLDGEPWPGRHGSTSAAAPRVYELIASRLFRSRQVNESSAVAPAGDLYEAVVCWYGRRNATGHYGRFDPSDVRQQEQRWFSRAQKTASSPAWLTTFERIASNVLGAELMTAGAAAIT